MCVNSSMKCYHIQKIEELLTTGKIKEARPSDIWYNEKEDFSKNAIGTDMEKHTTLDLSYCVASQYLMVRF